MRSILTRIQNTTIEDFSDDLSEQFETWKKEYREHSHRIKNVPLCADDCDSWYDACKDELTCTNDWYSGFTWEKGYDGTWHNLCKNTTEKACKPISFYYSNSKDFCQVRDILFILYHIVVNLLLPFSEFLSRYFEFRIGSVKTCSGYFSG